MKKNSLLWGVLLAVSLWTGVALADDVTLIGLLGGKAMFKINGKQQLLTVGQQVGQVKLLRLDSEKAEIQVGDATRTLHLGEGYVSSVSGGSLTLTADAAGHYFTEIHINGATSKAIVDTGATYLSMSEATAKSLHISYLDGRQSATKTANGLAKVWLVQLPRVDVGTIALFDVATAVIEGNALDITLVGTSVLSRFQVKYDSNMMTLTKK
ncbi:retropepsin-like aspartic protease family protein [Andreprevotia chitinilytica]|uniref:retropepsin-like aspartic protease family protein n=1 Tax=Andreprevotia chitinilytica TaxID=396808 RepID=UPI000553C35D|nr:TIGR02281 family clan AA aspartic protease [Andreprevotia chitinilytica]